MSLTSQNTAQISPSASEEIDLDELCINTIRTLAMDAVQKANSGHPGTPMALAPVAYALWQQFLRYDPKEPAWPNRDRFVLSNGHASMLLYALLHLAGVKAKDGPAVRRPPDPWDRAAATPSAWRSPRAGWRRTSIAPASPSSTMTFMRCAAMA